MNKEKFEEAKKLIELGLKICNTSDGTLMSLFEKKSMEFLRREKQITKKEIKQLLKNNRIRGWSRAIISPTGWITTSDLCGKIENGILELNPIDRTNKINKKIIIKL